MSDIIQFFGLDNILFIALVSFSTSLVASTKSSSLILFVSFFEVSEYFSSISLSLSNRTDAGITFLLLVLLSDVFALDSSSFLFCQLYKIFLSSDKFSTIVDVYLFVFCSFITQIIIF